MDKLPIDSKFVHWIQPYDKKVVANLIDSNAMLTTSHVQVDPVHDLTPRVSDMMTSLEHQWNYTYDSLGSFLRQEGRVAVKEIDEYEVKWRIAGKGHFHARVVENVNENIEYVGVGDSTFELKLDVDWWKSQDVISPVSGIYKINVRIIDKYADGDSTVYRCEMVDSSDKAFLDQAYLEVGRKWVKLFGGGGEASSDRGSFMATGEAPTFIELRNKMTKLSGSVEITDKAMQTSKIIMSQERKLATPVGGGVYKPNPDQPVYLMNDLEAKFIAAAKQDEQRALLFSRHSGNKNIDHSSGFVVDQGAGLFEFLETGNQMEHPVNSFAVDMLIDAIKQRWYNRVKPENRNIIIWTGEGGLELVQEFFERKLINSGAQVNYSDITSPGGMTYGSGYEGRRYRTSYITEYQMMPYGSFKFGYLPMLDDLTFNEGPRYKGRPHSSYYFIAMDIGMGQGVDSNVHLFKVKGQTNYFYHCGAWSPAGPVNNMSKVRNVKWSPGHTGDFFSLNYSDYTGIVIKDASRTLFSVPALKTI